jgi:hypothetical protein
VPAGFEVLEHDAGGRYRLGPAVVAVVGWAELADHRNDGVRSLAVEQLERQSKK